MATWHVRSGARRAQKHRRTFKGGSISRTPLGRTITVRTTDLVEFVANYGGAPLPPETLHTFARLCELNLYDEDKFPWTNFGEALARIGGVHALAVVARMADREKASLGLSLPPLLTSLVKHCRLGPEFAVGLIG